MQIMFFHLHVFYPPLFGKLQDRPIKKNGDDRPPPLSCYHSDFTVFQTLLAGYGLPPWPPPPLPVTLTLLTAVTMLLAGFTSNSAAAIAVQLIVVRSPRSTVKNVVQDVLAPTARSVNSKVHGEPSMLPPDSGMAVTVTVPEAGSAEPLALATVTTNSLPSEPSTIFLGTCKPDTSLIKTS